MSVIAELEGKTSNYRIWTEDENDTLRRYYGKCSTRDLVPYLQGRSISSITQRAIKLGLAPRAKARLANANQS